jgi:hypothetical protein
VEQIYSEIEVTADDIPEVIAIVVGRRGASPSTRSAMLMPRKLPQAQPRGAARRSARSADP